MRSFLLIASLLIAAPSFANGRSAPSQHQRDAGPRAGTAQRAPSSQAPRAGDRHRSAHTSQSRRQISQRPQTRGPAHTYRGQTRAPAHRTTRGPSRTVYQGRHVQRGRTYGQGRPVRRADPWNRAWRPAPRQGFVWVGGHYDHYGWVPGYWQPTRNVAGSVWVHGYWDGGYWVDGYWRTAHRPGYVWVGGRYNGRNYVRGQWRQSRSRRVVYR